MLKKKFHTHSIKTPIYMPRSSIQKRSNTCHSAPNDYYPNYPHSRVLSWHFVFGVFSVPHVYRSFCVLNGGKNASAFIDPFYYSNCWLFCTNIQQKRQKKKSDLISLLLNTWTLYSFISFVCTMVVFTQIDTEN